MAKLCPKWDPIINRPYKVWIDLTHNRYLTTSISKIPIPWIKINRPCSSAWIIASPTTPFLVGYSPNITRYHRDHSFLIWFLPISSTTWSWTHINLQYTCPNSKMPLLIVEGYIYSKKLKRRKCGASATMIKIYVVISPRRSSGSLWVQTTKEKLMNLLGNIIVIMNSVSYFTSKRWSS